MTFEFEDELAAVDALGVGERADVEQRLARGDLAADYPVKRAAVQKLGGAFRHHARRVEALRLLAALAHAGEALGDPRFEIADRIGADAEF